MCSERLTAQSSWSCPPHSIAAPKWSLPYSAWPGRQLEVSSDTRASGHVRPWQHLWVYLDLGQSNRCGPLNLLKYTETNARTKQLEAHRGSCGSGLFCHLGARTAGCHTHLFRLPWSQLFWQYRALHDILLPSESVPKEFLLGFP